MMRILIDVKPQPYPVYLARGGIRNSEFIRFRGTQSTIRTPHSKSVIITNRKIFRLYGKRVSRSLKKKGFQVEVLLIPDGERFKNQKTVTSLYTRLLSLKVDRQTPIIALGGGVVGDITGFVTATYMRGVPLIHIPTTLIAQIDSSIGGKTGINLPQGKNLVGSFYHPSGIFVDPDLLKTLSKRAFISGLAEVVKYGCIASPGLFQYLERNVEGILKRKPKVLERIILESIQIKGRIVAKDPTERNLRRILNFGHTIGHGLETLSGYRRFSHGEAVAIGMTWASQIAVRLGYCTTRTENRIVSLLRSLGLPTILDSRLTRLDLRRLWQILEHDKKVRGGRVHFVLPKRIGQVFITDQIDRKTFIKALKLEAES
ncbi:3-dehydroquinate synthase [candidate division TA06 bacterium]|nr:3-dehydroquinate synthase [candidate division TA06 bacterium]